VSGLLAISVVLFLGVLSPGPNFVLVTSTSMMVSRRAGLLAALGLAAASCTWVLLAIGGLGVVITRIPWLYMAVRLAGAAYLIWIGARMMLDARTPMPATSPPDSSGAAAAARAFVASMTNPKALAFYGSIFSVMVPAAAPRRFYAAVVLICTVISLLWYCGMAVLFSHGAARRIYARAKTAIETTTGLVLVGLGGKLLFTPADML
jgi:threonine efflux protein